MDRVRRLGLVGAVVVRALVVGGGLSALEAQARHRACPRDTSGRIPACPRRWCPVKQEVWA